MTYNQLTTKQFIERARKIHGNKYNYSRVNYKNNHTLVCIICPEHGEFWQTPNKHLMGQGCPKCVGKHKTTDDFIQECKKVHGDKYDYSKVKYINAITPVCIVCLEHGEFWQTPNKHLMGNGCPKCRHSHLEKTISDFLKKNNIKFDEQKKFDWLQTSKYSWQRLDFYLPDYNIAIECQGEQHFKPVDFSDRHNIEQGKINLLINKKRDKIKNKKCASNKIKLLYYTNKSLLEKAFENNKLYNMSNTFSDKNKLLEAIIANKLVK